MPLPAEGYLNFGLAGLLVEAVLLGIIYRTLYAYRARHQTNAAAVLAYALGVAFFVLVWRGGLLGGHLGLLGAYAVLLAAVVLGCGLRRQRTEETTGTYNGLQRRTTWLQARGTTNGH